jgi:hypothetical protein
VNLLYWDRLGNPTVDGAEVWLTTNRQYTWTVNTDYSATKLDPLSADVTNHGTWNWVWYKSVFTTGDVVTLTYANPLQVGKDNFTFKAPSASSYNSAKAKSDVDKVNVFPNPYYGYANSETSRQGHFVTFSHLPQKATIRIFDLAGVQVNVLTKNDPSQFITWDMTNAHNYPVASGIYVVYVDMPDLGVTKVLKFAMIQEEQILNVY